MDKINPTQPEAPMARKNPERDLLSATAFVKWKTANSLSDGQIAKMVGRSAAAVATWRNGTRPMGRERDVLKGLTGWHWDEPPAADYEPSKAKTTKKVIVRRPSVDSVEALIIANEVVRGTLESKRVLSLKNPDEVLAMRVCSNLMKGEVTRRQDEIEKHRKTTGLRDMVMGHRDPKEALRFLREHAGIDSEIIGAIERSLPSSVVEAAA